MSKPTIFTDKLVETNLNDAYEYKTHSDYIKNIKVSKYSPVCVFCSCNESFPLTNDGGSFRCCFHCKKNFKANPLFEKVEQN